MIVPMLHRQLLAFVRSRRFHLLALVLLGLCAAASAYGWARAGEATKARALAESSDRANWVNQGKNNPHGAAHFGRYAFRPTPALAAFDPGLQDHAGAAVWMEAHYQNPATLRRAETVSSHVMVAAISPGWVIAILGTLTLVVLLSPMIAGEREHGTMRAVSAAGVTSRDFMLAKLIAAILIVSGVTLVGLTIALSPALTHEAAVIGGARVGLLIVTYVLGLIAFGLVVLALSARARTTNAALTAGVVFWLYAAIWTPVIAAQLAVTLHPNVDEQAFKATLQLEAQTPFWEGDARESAIAKYEAKVLKAYDGDDLESLGFNRDGLQLQAHEEFANAVFDRLYGELRETHKQQDDVLRWASLASPVLALRRISAGLCGTDLAAQDAFVTQAESHRRQAIAALNEHMMRHAGTQGYAYMADRALWETSVDFEGRQPRLADVLKLYWIELSSLFLWLSLGGWFAVKWMTRAMRSVNL